VNVIVVCCWLSLWVSHTRSLAHLITRLLMLSSLVVIVVFIILSCSPFLNGKTKTHTHTHTQDDPCVFQSRKKHREREGGAGGRAGGREGGRKGRPFLFAYPTLKE